MSLLNDMLHDLAQQNNTPQISPRLKAVSSMRRHHKKLPLTQIGLVVIWGGALTILLSTMLDHNAHKPKTSLAQQPIKSAAQPLVITPKAAEASQHEEHADMAQAAPESQALQAETVKLQVIEQPMESNLAKETPPAPIESTIEEVPEWLLSYIEPLANASNQWVNINQEPQDITQEDLASAVVNKVYAPLSLDEWHDVQMNKALSAIDEGSDVKAAELLKTILVKMPQSVDARESLASIHLNNGNLAEAGAIIQQGLTYTPANPSLLTIKARIFLEQGRSAEAIKLLARYNPSLTQFPDYYGTLAAAFQSEGRISDAGSLYKSLLRVEPENSQYWLGYAMALEYNNKKNQAIEAYNKVTQGLDSDPAVRDYAENRLKTLQG